MIACTQYFLRNCYLWFKKFTAYNFISAKDGYLQTSRSKLYCEEQCFEGGIWVGFPPECMGLLIGILMFLQEYQMFSSQMTSHITSGTMTVHLPWKPTPGRTMLPTFAYDDFFLLCEQIYFFSHSILKNLTYF